METALIVSGTDTGVKALFALLGDLHLRDIQFAMNGGEARRRLVSRNYDLVVINTPLPAVSDAIFNATGTRFYELPITPEKIAMAVAERKAENE